MGRGRSLESLRSKLAEGARLVTITGPGGVGKTRLARELASDETARDAMVLDLSEATAPEDLTSVMARGLDVPVGGPRSSTHDDRDPILSGLAARGDVLIVLDNFEQLDDACATRVAQWVEGAPRSQVVVTSRRRLRVPGEHVFELAPLPLPSEDDEALATNPAVQLFVERAAMAGAEVTTAELPEVAAIVRELDGLPLAIELAAARCRLLSPAALRERLVDRFALLADGTARDDGQATLCATLDWSWSQLSERGRRALAACSVFRGGWDLAAARAALGTEERETIMTLEELSDQSLVNVERGDGTRRFRLFATVRAYASERLDEGAVHERHARHYARRAEELTVLLRGRDAPTAFAELAADADNMLAAVQHLSQSGSRDGTSLALQTLVGLAPVYERLGPIDHYAAQLARSWSWSAGVDAALRSAALVARGRALEAMGSLVEACQVLERAMAEARRSGTLEAIAAAAIALGWAAGTRGDFEFADIAFDEGEALCRELGDRWLEGQLHQKRGYLRYRRGDRRGADADMHRAAETFRELGARREEAFALGWMGFIADGRARSAVPHFRRSVQMLEELGDVRHLARHLQYLAVFEVETDPESAAEHFERSLELHRRAGDRQQVAVTLARRAVLLVELGDARRALDDLLDALASLDGESDLLYRGEVFVLTAAAEAELGLEPSARHHLDEAERILEPLRYPCLDAIVVLRARCDAALPERDEVRSSRLRELAAGEGIDASYALTRFAMRCLMRALGEARGALVVAHDTSWFESSGKRTSLARRAPMRRILDALVDRYESGGRPLSAADLVAAGWPGDDLLGTSGESRVYTTVRRLRKMGLGDHLLHDGAGYLLTGEVKRRRRSVDDER